MRVIDAVQDLVHRLDARRSAWIRSAERPVPACHWEGHLQRTVVGLQGLLANGIGNVYRGRHPGNGWIAGISATRAGITSSDAIPLGGSTSGPFQPSDRYTVTLVQAVSHLRPSKRGLRLRSDV